MISLRLCLIALAMVFVAMQTVSTLECYECDQGKNCSNTMKNVTCDNTTTNACLSLLGKDKKPIALGCINKTEAKEMCDTGLYANCNICEENLCNSSPFNAPSIFTITIFAAVIAKIFL